MFSTGTLLSALLVSGENKLVSEATQMRLSLHGEKLAELPYLVPGGKALGLLHSLCLGKGGLM